MGDAYYDEVGQPLSSFVRRIAEVGYAEAHRWWQPARLHAAGRIVELQKGSVVAFGAGHSHFEDAAYSNRAIEVLADCRVVLLLPDPDLTRSVEVIRERCSSSKGTDWIHDGHDYLQQWVTSKQSQRLADLVVYSDGSAPAEYADRGAAALG